MSSLIRKETATAVAAQEQVGQYLTFLVGGETFAVSILDVKEIIEIASVTRVPLTPDYIHGVINLRGNVVAVIDLSARLSRSPSQVSKRSCIVLVAMEINDTLQLVGMLVDEVREILESPAANIQPAPDFGADIRTDFIEAMARIDDVFIILLALDRVLSLEELSLLGDLTEAEALRSAAVEQ